MHASSVLTFNQTWLEDGGVSCSLSTEGKLSTTIRLALQSYPDITNKDLIRVRAISIFPRILCCYWVISILLRFKPLTIDSDISLLQTARTLTTGLSSAFCSVLLLVVPFAVYRQWKDNLPLLLLLHTQPHTYHTHACIHTHTHRN